MSISHRAIIIFTVIVFLLCPNGHNTAAAAPVTESDVNTTVANWLQETENHFGETLGTTINQIKLYRGGIHGNVGYFLVTLSPNGWVILPADDDFWPIQTFGPGVMSEALYKNTLWYKAVGFNSYTEAAARGEKSAESKAGASLKEKRTEQSRNKARWKSLKESAQKTGALPASRSISTTGLTASADIRVAPLMGRERYWGQGYPFNVLNKHSELTRYSTSSSEYAGTNVSEREYLVGCAALSTGQVMYNILTRKYPVSVANGLTLQVNPTDRTNFNIDRNYINGAWIVRKPFNFPESNLAKTYDWQAMSNFLLSQSPDLSDQTYQVTLQSSDIATAGTKIAPLLRDISLLLPYNIFMTGATVSSETPYNRMLSVADLSPSLFTIRYGFSSAHRIVVNKTENSTTAPAVMLPEVRKHLINTNLDFGFPVIAGFTRITPVPSSDDVGHASPVDGYAFDSWQNGDKIDYSEPYYHVVTGLSQKQTDPPASEWLIDPGAWTYGFFNKFKPDISNSTISLLFNEVVYNIFPSINNISDDIDYSSIGLGNSVAIISGRVAKYKNASDDIGLPHANIDIDIYWDGTKRYTTKTNEKGIFAGLVATDASSNEITIKAPDAKKLLLPDPLWKDSIPQNMSLAGTNEFVIQGVANRWLPDLGSVKIGGVKTTYETSSDQAAMFAAKGRIENENVVIIDKTDLAAAELSSLGSGVLFIGSDPAYDFNGDYDADAAVNVMQFVSDGGTVVTIGKSTAFPRFRRRIIH
ncbi:MAG: hypothetical protein Q4D58_01575 [Synergistaceae bacterium]|nr:hypothetical protein [Synergistaceae bacterium]